MLNRINTTNFSYHKSLFKAEYDNLMTYSDGDSSKYKSPDEVAEAVVRALFAE